MTLEEEIEYFVLKTFYRKKTGEIHEDELAKKYTERFGLHISDFSVAALYSKYPYFDKGYAEHDRMYKITKQGEKKYKYLRGKKRGETVLRVKDYLNIVVFMVTITSAIITTMLAMRSVGNNQKRIEELEKEVRQLSFLLHQSSNPNLQNAPIPHLKKQGQH